MADKNFKVKKNIQVTDLAVAGPVTVDSSGILASSSALPVNLGGTGQTSASAAFDALVPSQTNNANKLLGTNGTSVSWVSPGIAYQTSAPDNPVTGQLWVDSDETGDSLDPYIIRRKTITATAGQTVFTTDVVFTDGYEQIYYNGVLLVRTTDYTTNGGTNTVTLLQGASAGDTVEIISSTPINLVNTATISGGNTFTGFQTIQNSSNVSTNANLRIINDGSAELLELYRNEATGLLVRRYNGTYSSQTGVLSGQRSAFMIGSTFDGTTYSNNSAINMFASENQTSTARGSFINFETTLSGTVGRAERMRIDASGNIGIGATAPANTRLYVYNSDVSNPVQSVLHNANAGGSRYLLLGSSGTNAGALTWDNNNGRLSLDSLTTAPLLFRTNNTTAMWIDTSQKVGIGTTVPAVKLQVDGTFGFRDNSQTVPAQDNGTNPTLIMTNNFSGGSGETNLFNTVAGLTGGIRLSQVTGTGTYKDMAWFQRNANYSYVPFYSQAPSTDISFSSGWNSGTSTAVYNYVINAQNNTGNALVVFVNGSTRSEDNGANALVIRNDISNMYLGRSGATTFIYGRSDVSDQDLKENIQTYSNGVDIIKSLIPKQFNFIGSERTQYGFIAQDIESEEIVIPGGEGSPWSVDYNSIVSALVKANQELAARVELLEAAL